MMLWNCKKIRQEIAVSFWEVGERIQELSNYLFIVYKRRGGKGHVYRDTGTNSYYILNITYKRNFKTF